ncbi:phospholipase D family protein [Pseudoxanthomonas dokdonensis]|uniref:Cardiolipin synthase n=1 Tax=Pseudoxanthomonas dokdonensis TaxID=344882 RepID=A0A0R0CRI0_9GAMM|nr:phospholipase D family protein [Pseudoxanthomonas dokdonensis]KRG72000.1 cardiolipin synthase [Pseudoxanthomonas dokdonensis]
MGHAYFHFARVATLCLLSLLAGGCASLTHAQHDRAASIAVQARSQIIDCRQANACALDSPLYALGQSALAQSTPQSPRHYAIILESGHDSLLARLNLIRSARREIDLQTYIFDKDDSARLVLDELLAAARRGVRVRVLIDQLSAIADLDIIAALSGAHENFSMRIYNPTFGKVKLNYFDYAGSVLCCFRRFNQRMHTKLLVVDGELGITGGRNYQDDYYDWDGEYNFRDRDVLIAGPEAAGMVGNFEAFWQAPRSVPAERLDDVGRYLLRNGVPSLPDPAFRRPQRVRETSRQASDSGVIEARLLPHAYAVRDVEYVADLPQKHEKEGEMEMLGASTLEALVSDAQQEVLLQTPYLVMSDRAQEMFRGLRERAQPPTVLVSTNSLAATDNPVVYSMSFKYKRRYLREFGFHIYEYKPFPADAPIDYAALVAAEDLPAVDDTDDDDSQLARSELASPPVPGSRGGNGNGQSESYHASAISGDGSDDARSVVPKQRAETRPSFLSSGAQTRMLPLKRAGIRMGLHAKSMVIDGRIGVIGTHNFDPRSETYNTESAVIIRDPAFAHALEASIRRDMSPANAWVIAPREKPPVFSGLDYSMAKVSEALPIFDVWPWRYATSYEFQPGPDCPAPLSAKDPDFHRCYQAVGDFPEVNVGPKWLYTRILTAFGAGLVPIL